MADLHELAVFQHRMLSRICEAYNDKDWAAMHDVLLVCTTQERRDIATELEMPLPN